MKLQLFVVFIFGAASLTHCILLTNKSFSDCGLPTPSIKWINMTNCVEEPCLLKTGQIANVMAEIVSNYEVNGKADDSCKLIVKVRKVLFWKEVMNIKLCDHMSCKLKKGDAMKLNEDIKVPEKIPNYVIGNALSRWTVVCEDKELACASVNIRLADDGTITLVNQP